MVDLHVAAAVLTISDGVVAGTREDRSGEALERLLREAGCGPVTRRVVPDEVPDIETAVRELAAGHRLVLTTGGTGLGPRDVTPEATATVLDRQVPGLAEKMRAVGRDQTPMADLSRGLVGAIGETLVINLPGSPSGAVENVEAVLATLPHALDLLAGRTQHGRDGHGGHGHDEHEHAHDHDHGGQGHGRDDHADHTGRPARGGAGSSGTAEIHAELARRVEAGEAVVLATAIRAHGSPPCDVGQKLLLGEDGPLSGTLGCAEFDSGARSDVAEALASGRPITRTYEHDLGSIEVQLEPHRRRRQLVVLGATPVALNLLRWGRDHGFEPVLVDPRTDQVTPELRAAASRVASSPAELHLDEETAAAHTDHDAPDITDHLETLLRAGVASLQVMGSRRHTHGFIQELEDRGLSRDEVARIRTPAGLDIGGRSPQEIALSILAGVVAADHDADGGWITPHASSGD